MPSRAVDEAWHGFILCTQQYARFCEAAYGTFLHHEPSGAGGGASDVDAIPPSERLGRTVVAWSLAAAPGERCVMRDLDVVVGVAEPWGVPADVVAAIEAALA